VRRDIIKVTDFPFNKGCSVAGIWMQQCVETIKVTDIGSSCYVFSGHS
jgi:hypothetical protein